MESIDLGNLVAGLEDRAREAKSILMDNMIGSSDIIDYFRVMPGLLDEQPLTDFIESDEVMKPYKNIFEGTATVRPKTRTLKVRTTKVELEFEPLLYEKTFLSHNFHAKYKADTKQAAGFADFSMYILNVILQKVRYQLTENVFSGVYNPSGNTGKDAFDGLLKIVENDIAANEIPINNVFAVPELLSSTPVDVYNGLEKFFKLLPPRIWFEPFNLFVSPETMALYNEGFREVNKTNVWYDTYNRQFLLSGNGRNVRLIGAAGLSGTPRVILTIPSNLFFGFDTKYNMDFQKHDWKIRVLHRFNVGVQYGSSRFVWTNEL